MVQIMQLALIQAFQVHHRVVELVALAKSDHPVSEKG
jgi:hypothetical protein